MFPYKLERIVALVCVLLLAIMIVTLMERDAL